MKTVLLAGVAAAALALPAATASAAHSPAAVVKGHLPGHMLLAPKGGGLLYDQTGNTSSVAIDSQNFESAYSAYDDAGADDFTVPSGHVWKVKEVDAPGTYYNGSGPATSVDVTFYKNSGGLPGNVAKNGARTGLSYTDVSGFGSFKIDLTQGGTQTPVKLKAGTYWVSVVANCPFSSCGQWGWSINTVQHGNPGAWENPGGGFGVCPTWAPVASCVGYGPDFVFALRGKDVTL
jgi:hypothetical protein